ncbi:MAG TPA: chemotaxis protein CheD [Longimicrobiales bacterium]|nr:chemotaxis protein CheD [Longimicrobiales bacterium]
MTEPRIFVRASETATCTAGRVLAAVGLGSCVVIALYDPDARVAGLAHPLLPEPPAHPQHGSRGRYVTTAVPELLGEMERAGADRTRVFARLAGGASMFETLFSINGGALGTRNAEAARAVLAGLAVPVRAEAVGGRAGRSVYLHGADGRLVVRSVGRPDVDL